MNEQKESFGNIIIKDEAIARLARIAACKVANVKEVKGNLLEQFIALFWKGFPYNGIRITIQEKEVNIDISVFVEYGADIGVVGAQVQEKVREAIEKMAGFSVAEVNVNVVGVG